eukprot:GHVU01192908.1.p1 GENE.GHVU01192908.1~~GHVU01192908.1.p1  ORF type:complete len:275 (-),score=32.68 GHVU01192908.1:1050-1874(-)
MDNLQPWLEPYVGCRLLDHGDHIVDASSITAEFVGIYFSAHWCPPCRNFTPVLAKLYQEVKKQHKNFEIIFVSSDKDEAGFREYFNRMPWMAVPFQDRGKMDALKRSWNVNHIPCLVLIKWPGQIVTADGVARVQSGNLLQGMPPASPPATVEGFEKALTTLLSTAAPAIDDETKAAGVNTILRLITNMYANYTASKYRIVRKANPTVSKQIVPHPALKNLLLASGFRESADMTNFECPPAMIDRRALLEMKSKLEEAAKTLSAGTEEKSKAST